MCQIRRARRSLGEPMSIQRYGLGEREQELEYLTFPLLERTGIVKHLFSTRTGGVSRGIFESLNLSFNRGDDRECVLENYRRAGLVLGTSPEHMVLSRQTHTTNIRRVSKEDAGSGIVRPSGYENVDGLITDCPGLVLVTSFADCVPLYFVDVRRRVIGLAHSGWRGTADKMGQRMAEAMGREFGSRPEDLFAAVGPSICQDCYQVSSDVAERFEAAFGGMEEFERELDEDGYRGGVSGARRRLVEPTDEPEKYKMDLWRANLLVLRAAGIPLSQIAATDICTCHNPRYLFSHRASRGQRGNLGAFLMLKGGAGDDHS